MSEFKGLQRIGRYRLEAELGKGAMGVVYRARDERIDRLVALKTLHSMPGMDEAMALEVKQRFLNEAKAAGRLNHPNIVTVFDADEDEASGLTYLAMELVEGVELKTLINEGQLTGDKTLTILTDVAAALDHAHERGVIHRDVKPANIMVDKDGKAQLADFGIARLASSTMTQAGALLGSPAYMSPEQIRGRPVDPASDIFSLAVILYECLTGNRPFGGTDMITTTQSIVTDEPPPPSSIRSSLDPLVDAVLARGLCKTPEGRFATASAMMESLGDALAGRPLKGMDIPTIALPPGSLGPAASPPASEQGTGASKKGLALALLAVALLVLGVLAGSQLGGGGETEQAAGTLEPASMDEATPHDPKPEALEKERADPETQEGIDPTSENAEAGIASELAELPATDDTTGSTDVQLTQGTLAVDLSTFSSGRLIVTNDRTGEVILNRTVSSLKRRRGLKFKNPKRHFELSARLDPGRYTFRFTFKVRDGKTLSKRSVKDIRADQTLHVEVDVGTLGRDLDVEYP